MTIRTKAEIAFPARDRLPDSLVMRTGQYARFAANGVFLRVEDSPSHGLGFVFRLASDGTLNRVFGL